MSLLFRLMVCLLLLPSLGWAQALSQEKVGLYMASKAGADCSQTTLALADAAALALGQTLAIPATDRFGMSCQWVIVSDMTLQSPVFIPYKPTPAILVQSGVTLTLAQCPYVWGDYDVIDAAAGTLAYTQACTQCTAGGAHNWTSCTVGGGAGNVVSPVADGGLIDLSGVDPDTATEGIFLPQGASCAAAITLGQACVNTNDGTLWLGNDSASVQVGAPQTLQDVFANGGTITTADCATTPLRISRAVGADDYWNICMDGDIPSIEAVCNGGGCPKKETIATGQTFTFVDGATGLDMLIIDPAAVTPEDRWQFQAGYEFPAASGDITDVFGCTSGDCASIALADGDYLDMSAVDPNTTTEGLRLPQAASCAAATALGQVCVDTDDGVLYVGSGSAAVRVPVDSTLPTDTPSCGGSPTLATWPVSGTCINKGVFYNGDDDPIQFDLPAAAANKNFCFNTSTFAQVVTVAPDAADTIVFNGVAASAGEAIVSTAAPGQFLCLHGRDDATWFEWGFGGTWAEASP